VKEKSKSVGALITPDKENSLTGKPLGEDRSVVALMRVREFMDINSD
jgi:hypothetical protein